MDKKYYKDGVCEICGGEFKYNPYSQTGKFCGNKCHAKYRFVTETIPKVERGEVSKRDTLKKYIVEVRGEECELCSQGPEWNGQFLVLQLDHINGDSDNDLPENIRLACPNCHTQTETFSARNRKNSKRSNYMEGYRKNNKVRC